MNNLIKIMALSEDDMHRVAFINGRDEAGINSVYNPENLSWNYQVFIHKELPYRTAAFWDFDDFAAARRFAADTFSGPWEFLAWDQKPTRPCENGGGSCGSGSCGSKDGSSAGGCGSSGSGGGCSSCGV